MKRKLGPLIVFALLIALTPALSLLSGGGTAAVQETASGNGGTNTDESATLYEGGTILVLDEGTDELLTLSERDYVIGALLCEMPALYEIEALKAQAVACHTYALHVQSLRAQNPDPALRGAAFAVNSLTYTGYTTKAQAQALYGTKFAEYYTKMSEAVDTTLREILTYNGAPISACYHAISPGRTEYSENVFVSALPYLVSVDSHWDTEAKGYETEVRYAPGQFSDLLASYDPAFIPTGDPSSWLGDNRTSEAGTVLSQTICGRDYAGHSLRSAMNLRSAAFTLRYDGSEFIFVVHGYGHGVGMSQNGANGMALEGATYAEILAHYYPTAQLTRVA